MAGPEVLRIEVVYALPEWQILVKLELPPGATAGDAVLRSGLPARCPEIDPQALPLGIFGRAVEPTQRLQDGDRVEIYRALRVDPKDARRARVARERRKGKV